MDPQTPTRRRQHPRARSERSGFTLIEIMVVVTIIGLMTTMVYSGSLSLFPQTELRASATDVAGALERARSHAMLVGEPIVFAYELDQNTYEAYYPYDRGENGERLGPGTFPVLDPAHLRGDMRFGEIRLMDSKREKGRVEFTIAPNGQMPTHDVVIVMPGYEDTQLYTVRALGVDPRARLFEGDDIMEIPNDASFR